MSQQFDGIVRWRGEPGYETARTTGFNGRVPERFPDVIVGAASEEDLVRAVALARDRGLSVTTRSGGHSWSAAFLRDGGVLIDLSRMRDATIDAAARTAVVQPGITALDLDRRLRQDGLFFPVGHCGSVALGGFLLWGGVGFNSRRWGPACASVRGVDVVTADGRMVHADEHHDADLFWAARGSGHGFFGVVARFHLALYKRPQAIRVSRYVYPIEHLDEVVRWFSEITPTISPSVEPMLIAMRGLTGGDAPGVMVLAPCITHTATEATEALSILESCPVRAAAVMCEADIATDLDALFAASATQYPQGARFAADNLWSDASADDLLPGVRQIVATLPDAPSHMMWLGWGAEQELPDMAFSIQAKTYIAVYAVYRDPARDGDNQAWVTRSMERMEPFTKAVALGDENIAARPFRFLADGNRRRLDEVRAAWDPGGVFHGYLGEPPG
jgi:FAD/FMN-containing dehydrogenase